MSLVQRKKSLGTYRGWGSSSGRSHAGSRLLATPGSSCAAEAGLKRTASGGARSHRQPGRLTPRTNGEEDSRGEDEDPHDAADDLGDRARGVDGRTGAMGAERDVVRCKAPKRIRQGRSVVVSTNERIFTLSARRARQRQPTTGAAGAGGGREHAGETGRTGLLLVDREGLPVALLHLLELLVHGELLLRRQELPLRLDVRERDHGRRRGVRGGRGGVCGVGGRGNAADVGRAEEGSGTRQAQGLHGGLDGGGGVLVEEESEEEKENVEDEDSVHSERTLSDRLPRIPTHAGAPGAPRDTTRARTAWICRESLSMTNFASGVDALAILAAADVE